MEKRVSIHCKINRLQDLAREAWSHWSGKIEEADRWNAALPTVRETGDVDVTLEVDRFYVLLNESGLDVGC